MMKAATRIEQLPRYLFAEIDRKIREAVGGGVDVIRLGIGDPDCPTPEYIINRMIEEVKSPQNHCYPPDDGLKEFKEAVSHYYQERYGVSLEPDSEVLPLIGSKEGIAHIPFCFTNPGDVNLVPDPGYPVYGIGTLFAGGEVFHMPLLAENNYLPSLKEIPEHIAHRSKLLYLNYPNNPTGATAPKEFFAEAIQFAKKYNIIICHDAAYTEIAYDHYQPLSLLEVEGGKEVGIEFNSLSKSFNMTGWRIGYAVGNPEIIEVLGRFKTNIDSGVFKAVQYAGVEAFINEEYRSFINKMQRLYQERRDVVMQALTEMGWDIKPPRATFYIWAPVPKGYTSQEFVSDLLEKTGVVVTPGRGFGEYGEGYFRIALTVKKDRLQEAMDRLKKVVNF